MRMEMVLCAMKNKENLVVRAHKQVNVYYIYYENENEMFKEHGAIDRSYPASSCKYDPEVDSL